MAFCLCLRWVNPHVFWNDDYQVSILPVLADIARSWREGEWPLLSPYSWACGNLAGEYQYGTFSVFVNALIVAVWRFPLSFGAQAAAMSIPHLAVLAAGCYLLARRRGVEPGFAGMVGIVGALNGWEIGWGATNWFGALAAHAWLPWAWWAFEAAGEPLSDRPTTFQRLRWLWPVPFVYLLLTGGFPYTVVMLALVSAWLGVQALLRRRYVALVPLATGWGLGLGLSAPAWLSLLEAMAGSHRATAGVGPGNRAWTVPFSALPGVVLPSWTTHWHNFSDEPSLHAALELAGAFVPAVALLAGLCLVGRRLVRACGWDFALLATVSLLCVLPSPGVFRWSFRWLPLWHIVLALAGARAWQVLWEARAAGSLPRIASLINRPTLWALCAVAVVWNVARWLGTLNPAAYTAPLPFWTLVCVLAWYVTEEFVAHRRAARWGTWLPATASLALLWVTYLYLPTNPGLPRYAFDATLSQAAPLSADRLYLSLYPAPEKRFVLGQATPVAAALLRPGSTSLFAGVRLVNGYSPIMSEGVGPFLRMATHGEVPPEAARDLLAREAGPARTLARMGVDGLLVAANYDADIRLPADDWSVAAQTAEGTVYHRTGPPLSAAALSAGPGESAPLRPLRVLEQTRGVVVVDLRGVEVGGGADVLFRRPYLPGYLARLDGARVPVGRSEDGLMPTVRLPRGGHRALALVYEPRAVVWGGAAAGMSLLAMALAAGWTVRRTRAERRRAGVTAG